MDKTASSMRTNPSLGGCNILWLPTRGSQGGSPEGPNKLRCKNSASRTKGNILSKAVTLGHKPPKGSKEKPNFPLIPKSMIKAPASHVKKFFYSILFKGGVIHPAEAGLQELRDFALRAAPPHVRPLG